MIKALPYKSAIGELQFLPSLHFLSILMFYGNVLLEKHENYNKGSFRNKCFVSSNQNSQYIIIPLKKGKHRSQPFQEVEIAYEVDWIKTMKHRLQTEYGNYPYFEYYIDDILYIIEQKITFLYKLNRRLIEYILHILDFDHYAYTPSYTHQYKMDVLDLRDTITPSYMKTHSHLLTTTQVGYFMCRPGHTIIESLFKYGPETGLLLQQYCASLMEQNHL